MQNIVVLYHGNCPDGFGGAWAAWKKFKNKAEYIGLQHHKQVAKGLIDKELYFIDFSYSTDVVKDLIKNNKKVTAIDHHITAKDAVMITKNYVFDTNQSGAVLSWKYFHPNKPVPTLLKHIEDIDLWRFKIPHTREIMNVLEMMEFDFNKWDKFIKNIDILLKKKKVIEQGKIISSYKEHLIKKIVDSYSEKVEFLKYKTLVANGPSFFSSDLGSALVKKMPPIGIVWSKKDGKIIVSLRSDGSVNVAEIAQKFGGGGHKAAAGFTVEINKPLPWSAIN